MQNGIDLTIGPLEQLNYETLKIVSEIVLSIFEFHIEILLNLTNFELQLTQKVYSFTMFLHNFEV